VREVNKMLEITPILYEDKIVLHNLIQFYRYDSSEFDGHVLNNHGLYLYKYLDHQWTDEYRRPLFVKVDGEIAGFALAILGVPNEFVKVSTTAETNVISDFFIMRKFRGKGYGKQAAFTIFDSFPGTWEIRQTIENLPAKRFWNRVIHDYTNGSYSEVILDGEKWNGPVQVFEQRGCSY
jgi:predicted acetyltransferase